MHQEDFWQWHGVHVWPPPDLQVHKTNGQYTRARKKMEELEAAAVVEGGARRRHLLASGTLDPVALAAASDSVASPAARGGRGRALLAWGKKTPPPPPPPVPGAGSVMYMVVGFEVVACSIFRRPGARLDEIPCPVSPEDPDAPLPMEVKEGAPLPPRHCLWPRSGALWADVPARHPLAGGRRLHKPERFRAVATRWLQTAPAHHQRQLSVQACMWLPQTRHMQRRWSMLSPDSDPAADVQAPRSCTPTTCTGRRATSRGRPGGTPICACPAAGCAACLLPGRRHPLMLLCTMLLCTVGTLSRHCSHQPTFRPA